MTVNQRDTASEIEQNDPTLPGYNYEMWHEGTNAIGYAVKSDGVHLGVSSRSTFIKGTTVNKAEEADDNLVSQADLQELISKASVKVAGTGTVSFQIPLHFGNNGSDVRALGNSFTTLLIRNLDAGNHTFSLTDQWSSSRTTGPFIGFEDHALGDLLDDLYATYDYVWLAGFGVQADLQETTAIVPSLVWDGTEYTFTQPETSTCAVTNPGTTTTNLDSNGWSFARTRATGHNEFVDNGLRVWTDGTDGTTNKVAGDHPITFDLPLADVGVPSIDLTNYAAEATSIPGFQLGVDFDNDGTQDGYLVGEVANGDQWWASASIVSNATWVGFPVKRGCARN